MALPGNSRVIATAIALSGITIEPGVSVFEETAMADKREVASANGSIVLDSPMVLGLTPLWCFVAWLANRSFNVFLS